MQGRVSPPPPIRRHHLLWMRLDRTIIVVVVKNDCFRYYHKRKYHGKRNAKPNLCNVFRKLYVHFREQTGSRNVAVRLERKRFVGRGNRARDNTCPCTLTRFFFTEMSRMLAVFNYAFTAPRMEIFYVVTGTRAHADQMCRGLLMSSYITGIFNRTRAPRRLARRIYRPDRSLSDRTGQFFRDEKRLPVEIGLSTARAIS